MNKDKLGKVGGQAVIEGVMMQSQDYRAIAVRKSDGEIEVKKERIKRRKFCKQTARTGTYTGRAG